MKTLKLLVAAIAFVTVIALPSFAAADVNDFTVTSFAAEETLTNNDRQGELHIVEHIKVNFTDNNHGILRAIPQKYKNHSLKLKINNVSSIKNENSLLGAPSEYTTYVSNGNTVLKIGSPNQTVTGPQEYVIDYTVSNVLTFYKDYDELYWNINGTGWNQPFDKITLNLHLPNDLKIGKEQPVCITGAQGSKSKDCTITHHGNTVAAATTKPLSAGENMSYVTSFQPGYFMPYQWYDNLLIIFLITFSVPIIVLGGGGALFWYRKGRDAKGTGIIIPQYGPPDNVKPAVVGAIIDFKFDNKDITALIIDLAVRRYIKILESDKKKFSLQLVNPDFTALDANERLLIEALFTVREPGTVVSVASLSSKLSSTADKLTKNVEAEVTAADYFANNRLSAPVLVGLLFALVFGFCAIVGLINRVAGIAGLIVGVIAAIGFLANIASRTAKGVAALEHIKGLKLYLNVAEKDRINTMQSPDGKYMQPTNEPVRTIELFEKLLPYAIILGVENKWAEKFEGLYLEPPDWYAGNNLNSFSTGYLAGSLNSGFNSSIEQAFSPPVSSGSGGGGGGFSGGGGGGGGGGGW